MSCYEDAITYTYADGTAACVPLDNPQSEHDAALAAGPTTVYCMDGVTPCAPDYLTCPESSGPYLECLPSGEPTPVQGAPAVPVGFEDKYGDAGWTIEQCEIDQTPCSPLQAPETAAEVGEPAAVVLAYTGASTALTAASGAILLLTGLYAVLKARRLRRKEAVPC